MKICPHCERPFERKRFGPAPKYCSTSCRVAAANLRAKADGRAAEWERAAAERRAAERAARPRKPCPYCGDLMANPRRVQCGAPECKRRHQAERTRAWMAAHRATTGERYQDRYTTPGECEDCGAPIRLRPGRKTMRCRRCAARMAGEVSGRRKKAIAATPEAQQQRRARKALNRARRRAAKIKGEDFDPLEIFERDGWRCGICKRKVGRTLEYPHPRSASLDHIVPIVDGGEHTRANTQCAHLECNLRRQHRGPGQLLLIG